MMSIGAALTTATLRLGHIPPAAPSGNRETVRTTREAEAEAGTSPEEAALLAAIEADLREAGYLAN